MDPNVATALDALVDDVGDSEIVRAIVTTYLAELGGRITAIEDAPDDEQRRRNAHALKSASATVGVTSLAAVSKAIEHGDASQVDELRRLEGHVQLAMFTWLAGDC
jgi:HPt (histidine-containing phosphotransfer) domain-containing protein